MNLSQSVLKAVNESAAVAQVYYSAAHAEDSEPLLNQLKLQLQKLDPSANVTSMENGKIVISSSVPIEQMVGQFGLVPYKEGASSEWLTMSIGDVISAVRRLRAVFQGPNGASYEGAHESVREELGSSYCSLLQEVLNCNPKELSVKQLEDPELADFLSDVDLVIEVITGESDSEEGDM